MAIEPKITVSTVDQTVGYNADPSDSRLNILCSAVTPAGPTDLTRVSGPSEFQRLYFGGRSVKTSDDMSAIYARALLANAPIWIKRAVRNNIKGGVSSALGSEVFVDSSLNPIDGVKVTFEANPSKSYATLVEDLLKKKIVKKDNFVYSKTDISSDELEKAVEIKLKSSITLKSKTSDKVAVSIKGISITVPANTEAFDLDFIQKNFIDNGLFPQSVRDASGNELNLIITDGVASTTEEKFEVKTISWMPAYTIISDAPEVIVVGEPSEDFFSFILKDNDTFYNELTVSKFVFDVAMNDGVTKYCFYSGNAATPTVGATQVHLKDNQTFENLFKELVGQCADLFGADTGNGNSIVIPNAQLDETEVDKSKNEGIKGKAETINTAVDADKFAIIAAFPCSDNAVTVNIEDGSLENTFKVTATYATLSEEWTFSIDDSSLFNGYGESLYYQRVNDESQLIRIVPLNGAGYLCQTLTFGDEVTSKHCGVPEMIAALEEMKETDESSVFFDFVCDSGVVSTSLSDYLWQLQDFYHSFYAPSCPTDETLTASKLKNYRSAFGDRAAGRYIGQTQYAQVLDSGTVRMPASYFYLKERISLANTSMEFRNIFGPNYGDIGMQKPIEKFTTADRESLLDSQIATLKKGITGNWYLNSNCTLYKTDSFLQEDGIVLMVNKINQLADQYSQSVIGLGLGTPEEVENQLRSTLETKINARLRVGTSEGPSSIRIVCDSTNNPTSLLNQGKLRVDIYATFGRSVKEVLVYTNVMPLS